MADMESAKKGVEAAGDVAGKAAEKAAEVTGQFMKIFEDHETELRLRFDNLTLNGDVALSFSLFKENK